MMSEKEFIKSQKDCADMLGMTLSEYQNCCDNAKVNLIDRNKNVKYDNSILAKLGLDEKDLKVRGN